MLYLNAVLRKVDILFPFLPFCIQVFWIKWSKKKLQSGRFMKEREFPSYQTKEGNLS